MKVIIHYNPLICQVFSFNSVIFYMFKKNSLFVLIIAKYFIIIKIIKTKGLIYLYIIKNALRCISRAKGRNILIALVVLLLSVSSCIGLSIKQANKTLKKQYADDMEISATPNPKNMRENGNISLETLTELSNKSEVKKFYYSENAYFSAGDGIEPVDVAGSFEKNRDFKDRFGDVKNGESTTSSVAEGTANYGSGTVITLANDTETEKIEEKTEEKPDEKQNESGTQSGEEQKGEQAPTTPVTPETNSDGTAQAPPQMPDGENSREGGGRGGNTFITNNFFFNMASKNDFTVTGYSDSAAIPDYISELGVINTESTDLTCVISKNLADKNSLTVGSTFTLKNPENEDETYTFTVGGICDTSKSSDTQDTASNASFTDNFIYVSGAALDGIISNSATVNTADENGKSAALSAAYNGTFIFANLENYNTFSENLDENYTLVSEDVSNYEQSVKQLETLGKYATYFLIVIFIIGAFVLIIINLFSIRNRKYEIGVLTAIGMKKRKVAAQFVIELFIVTFAAIIIGSGIGAVSSVPVTNSLLKTVNQSETAENDMQSMEKPDGNNEAPTPPEMQNGNSDNTKKGGGFMGQMERMGGRVNNYVASVKSATDVTVILEMILIGLGLTLISSLAAVTFVMRYEPLKILSNRD